MKILYRSPESEKEFAEYFNFRWELLRQPLGLEQGSEQDDLEESAFHIAAFNNQNIVGVGRLQIEKDLTARIRYMAVAQQYRNQGIGGEILNKLEAEATKNNIQTCWLYARENAVSFYLKNHYLIKGRADSELEIKHQRMEKQLAHSQLS